MLLRRVARPLLAGIFIQGGIAALRNPKIHADLAAPVIDRVTEVAPIDQPPSNVTLVRIDAGVKIGAGTLLALGKAPRFSAVALAATLIPTTVAGHRFWEVDDPNQRMNDQLHFMKNLGLLGGLMLAAADTEGKPSLTWRARRAGRTSAATAELLHQDITSGLGQLSDRAGQLTGDLAASASKAGGQAADAAARAGERVADTASLVGERTGQLLVDADSASSRALEQARNSKALKQARKAAKRARKRTAKRLEVASREASKRFDKASREASKKLDRASKRAAKESAKRLERASAKAQQARSTVESRLS